MRVKIFAVVVAALMLASVAVAQDQATRDFINSVNNMVGPDVYTDHLLNGISTSGAWGSRDENASELQNLVNHCIEITLIFSIKLKICPYQRLKPLTFCTTCKINSLTFNNNIGPESCSVSASGLQATKANGRLNIRQASGSASASTKKQYNVVKYHVCNKFLGITTNCWDENRNIERGFYAHELDAMTTKLQRESSLAIKREIQAKTGMSSAPEEESLTSLYLDESNRMRALYPQIEYDYSELDVVPEGQLSGAISAASLGNIVDGGILSRIVTVARSSARSSFIVVPQPSVFYVAAVNNLYNGNFRLRFSTFRVQGKLPTGAFVTSTGVWATERAGEGAVPSLSQIIAIFPALKA